MYWSSSNATSIDILALTQPTAGLLFTRRETCGRARGPVGKPCHNGATGAAWRLIGGLVKRRRLSSLAGIVSHRRPYSPSPIPIWHDTFGSFQRPRACSPGVCGRTASPQGVYEVCHAFAASLPRLLAVGVAAKACRPRGHSCFRGIRTVYCLRTGPRKHGTLGARTAKLFGNGRIRPCRTAPDDAYKSKADRPPSRAVSALRPWPAANPKRGRNESRATRFPFFPLANIDAARYANGSS
jgi:hypothetical protein